MKISQIQSQTPPGFVKKVDPSMKIDLNNWLDDGKPENSTIHYYVSPQAFDREGDKITMGLKFYIGEEKIVKPKTDGVKFYFSI